MTGESIQVTQALINDAKATIKVWVVTWLFSFGGLFGGQWQDGAAAGSGEDMELLFSYLSRLGIITKAMGPASTFPFSRHCFH
jgi:hypothetical protein